jgi:hypothetical protein
MDDIAHLPDDQVRETYRRLIEQADQEPRTVDEMRDELKQLQKLAEPKT